MFHYLIALMVLNSLALTPRPISNSLARFYVRILDLALPRLRRVAMRNLEMAFPKMPPGERRHIADGVFDSIARLLAAFAKFPQIDRGNISQWIRYEGYEHFEAGIGKGKGVLFATAHLGNWELSAFAHALLSAPMNVVVRPLDNARIDRVVKNRRRISGNRLIEKRDFARSILTALKNNEAVGVLIDQNASIDTGVFVDFFGIPACAGAGFAKLAAHSGAAVVPGFALWSGAEQKYVLRFYPPIEITGDVACDTSSLQRHLESVIREYPDQWLWIHRRWKTRPPGEKPLYD